MCGCVGVWVCGCVGVGVGGCVGVGVCGCGCVGGVCVCVCVLCSPSSPHLPYFNTNELNAQTFQSPCCLRVVSI